MVTEQVYGATTVAAAPYAQYATVAAAPQVQYASAAPAVTYAAPQMMTTQTPSYVAAPAQYMTSQAINPIVAPGAPMQPAKLTQGIPTPEQINAQKSQYAAALEKQLKEATATVQKECEIEKQMIKFNADKTIALFTMQVEEKLCEAIALEEERMTIATLELKKAFVERNLQLSAQASNLTMDYQMKTVQNELANKNYAFQMQLGKAEAVLQKEYDAQVAKAMTGTVIR